MIPLMKSAFYNEPETKQKLAEFIVNSEKLSIGNMCDKFESKFSDFQGCKHSVLFNSGSSANLALIQSLKNLNHNGLRTGYNVGFSAVTWATNVMPLIQLGLRPIPVDVDPETINSMSYNLEKTMDENQLDAFFITNVLGFCGDIVEIKRICNKNNILLIEDNCESLETGIGGKKTGSFGCASTFSFFVPHHMSTIEGGMVCTDDEDLAIMLKIVRAHGWDRNLPTVNKDQLRNMFNVTKFQAQYTFYDLAFNLRPTEITGFLGCDQIEYLPKVISIRDRNYKMFNSVMQKNQDFIPTRYETLSPVSCYAVPVICKTKDICDKYVKKFTDAGIEIRPIAGGNITRQPFYKKYVKSIFGSDLPGSDFIHHCGFYFGNCPDYTEEELEYISKNLECR